MTMKLISLLTCKASKCTGLKNLFRTSIIARFFRDLIRRVSSSPNAFQQVVSRMDTCGIETVLDIGANVGQFGIDMRRHGFDGQIVSFEPVNETFVLLTETIKKHKPWSALPMGLGSIESELTINISGNSGLSTSLLKMGSVHLSNFPETATVATAKVLISTLDKQLEVLGIDPRKILLKLDVQGYEAEVLKGASQSLAKIPLCYLEVSLVPLYEGETTFLPILNMLSEAGHEVIDVFRGLTAKNGQLLQMDILTKLTKD